MKILSVSMGLFTIESILFGRRRSDTKGLSMMSLMYSKDLTLPLGTNDHRKYWKKDRKPYAITVEPYLICPDSLAEATGFLKE